MHVHTHPEGMGARVHARWGGTLKKGIHCPQEMSCGTPPDGATKEEAGKNQSPNDVWKNETIHAAVSNYRSRSPR